jgi:hypothetical protein
VLLFSYSNVLASTDFDNYKPLLLYKSETKSLKTFQDWEVMQKTSPIKKSCYLITFAYRSKGFEGIRSLPFLAVEVKGKRQYTITSYPGFTTSNDISPILSIGGDDYLLSTESENYNYTYNSSQDIKIIDGMIGINKFVKIRSYQMEGGEALDFYSLKGFLGALKYAERVCN